MVKLTKIYTRGGDAGETSLGGGTRVKKHDLRVEAYGTVDETNACVGLVRLHTAPKNAEESSALNAKMDAILNCIQDDLFDLGADLCTPGEDFSDTSSALRITQGQIDRLEAEIDEMNADLADLTSFILPGGTPAAANLHLARTVARRAERLITALFDAEPDGVNPLAVKFMNRLSDHFFVLGRVLNNGGKDDVLWRPGANR